MNGGSCPWGRSCQGPSPQRRRECGAATYPQAGETSSPPERVGYLKDRSVVVDRHCISARHTQYEIRALPLFTVCGLTIENYSPLFWENASSVQ